MKIKTKKQFTLPQLIQWAWENDVKNIQYVCDNFRSKSVNFNQMGWAEFSSEFSYNPDDVFTVTAEKEITEETTFDNIVEINTHGEHFLWNNSKIANIIDYESEEFHAYIDREFRLIWRDGKLVE